MTAWARLARENSEQSCGNGGAMESQQPAFHSSLGISQKTPDSHIPTAPATGCFTGTKKDSKAKKTKAVYTKVLTPPWEHVTDDFRIANLRREPIVTLVIDGGCLEFTLSYVVDYLKRTVMKDQLFTRILEEVGQNGSKVHWASSSSPANTRSAPAPASQEGLAHAFSVAGRVAH